MSYQVKLTKKAEEELSKLEKEVQIRIVSKLKNVCLNPLHFCERLVGYDFYKLIVGDYRIILDLIRKDQLLVIHKIGHRRDIYKTNLESA